MSELRRLSKHPSGRGKHVVGASESPPPQVQGLLGVVFDERIQLDGRGRNQLRDGRRRYQLRINLQKKSDVISYAPQIRPRRGSDRSDVQNSGNVVLG
jgi:hypothetical protein